MAVDLTCFDGVLGLANCACPCLTDTAPDGYNDSTSGLFIADLIPLNMLEGADNCNDPANPWNLLSNARTQGANKLLKDLQRGLMGKNQPTRQPYKGMIGERTARDVLSLTNTYAGLRISAPKIKGGYMNITKIGGVFNASGSVSIQIYDRFNATVGSPVVITTGAGQHASTACSISLPLWADGAPWPEYFAVYTVNDSNQPRKTRLWCPTCSKNSLPEFSIEAPYYNRGWRGDQGWANWVMVGAWAGDSLTEFDLEAEKVLAGTLTNGLTLQVEFTCDPVSSVCLDTLDFNDPVALSLAHAYRYAAAIEAAEKIIRNPEPYRNAHVSREILAVDIPQWWKDYQTNVGYVVCYANTANTACIFCKPKFSMSLEGKLP